MQERSHVQQSGGMLECACDGVLSNTITFDREHLVLELAFFFASMYVDQGTASTCVLIKEQLQLPVQHALHHYRQLH